MVTMDYVPLWDSLTPLGNPGKGWYHHLDDIGPYCSGIRNDTLFHEFPDLDHLYLRMPWSYLEPKEGEFNWSLINEVVDQYVPLGYGISFSITSKGPGIYPEAVLQLVEGVHYATPYWVREAGAEGHVTLSGGTRDVYIWSPDWDDPVYLEKLDHFHREFAKRYDGKPWVRFVDIGSIGDYGGGNTNASTRIPPSVEAVKANLDVFLKNYRESQIVVSDALIFWNRDEEEVQELYDYDIENGITLRCGSCMVDWPMSRYRDTWRMNHHHFYDPLYLERPIILELSQYNSMNRHGLWQGKNSNEIPSPSFPNAEFLRQAVEAVHATYIGYHKYVEDFLGENSNLTMELLNRCGYWYFPVSARYPAVLGKGKNTLSFTWLNRGVAPAYSHFSLVLCLQNNEDGDPKRIVVDDAGNREWIPGKMIDATYSFKLSKTIENGTYQLKFKLKDIQSEQQRDIFLALDRSLMDQEHFITLGQVQVRK
jgi:hypothetical protein